MWKQVSRKHKNLLLIIINILFGLVLIEKVLAEDSLTNYAQVWLVVSPFIVLSHLLKTNQERYRTVRDMSLFLLTGGAIGTTVGELIAGASSVIEIAWLVLAIGAAFITHQARKINI